MSELLGVKITQALSNTWLDYCGFHRAELRIIKLGNWHSLTATCLHVITMSPFLSPLFLFLSAPGVHKCIRRAARGQCICKVDNVSLRLVSTSNLLYFKIKVAQNTACCCSVHIMDVCTVTLKVMAFCRPSGEICNRSDTARISWVLTTSADSSTSVWAHGPREWLHCSCKCAILNKTTEGTFQMFKSTVPALYGKRHCPSAVWMTALWICCSGLQDWSGECPWHSVASWSPPHPPSQWSHSYHPNMTWYNEHNYTSLKIMRAINRQ